ncbi:hypothetical protein MUK42_30332 [Musa troglodytarum]|uniref:Uncharacterized protein n=1 Tax=Musa troglodytarum TaxID=320322 RepID=A0A9E7K7M9_9LILI|nr:hypothetical protein MUK42_30332 [Musa troglodytarum]
MPRQRLLAEKRLWMPLPAMLKVSDGGVHESSGGNAAAFYRRQPVGHHFAVLRDRGRSGRLTFAN